MSNPRNHHYLPVFYIKQWAGPDGKLFEYSKRGGKLIRKRVGPRATAWERDLYSFSELPPEIATAVEAEFLSRSDALAARALDQVLIAGNQTPRTLETRSAWSRFVFGLKLRHPDAVAELRRAIAEIWARDDPNTRSEYQKIRNPDDPETFDEWIKSKGPTIVPKVQMRMLQAGFDSEKLGNHLNSMHWDVVDVSASGYRLLTSDWPAEIVLLSKPNGTASVPISPTKLFLAANRPESLTELRRISPAHIVKTVNKYVTAKSRRYVYSVDESHEAFIARHIHSKMDETPLFPELSASTAAACRVPGRGDSPRCTR